MGFIDQFLVEVPEMGTESSRSVTNKDHWD